MHGPLEHAACQLGSADELIQKAEQPCERLLSAGERTIKRLLEDGSPIAPVLLAAIMPVAIGAALVLHERGLV